jgi:hypothetical protein
MSYAASDAGGREAEMSYAASDAGGREAEMSYAASNAGGEVPKEDIKAAWIAEDIAQLRLYNSRGIKVVFRNFLHYAALNLCPDIARFLVNELGVDVNQRDAKRRSAIHVAASFGRLDMVQCLIELGADADPAMGEDPKFPGHFPTPLTYAAIHGHMGVVRWLLVDGGVSITLAPTHQVYTIPLWSLLQLEGVDRDQLTSLLQVMVLLDDAPSYFMGNLSPEHAELCTRGRELREKLPGYLERQRALVVEHCPLPVVLQPLVAEYAAPTSEDMWAYGLREDMTDCSGAGLLRCKACQQVGSCGQQCQRAHLNAHKVDCKQPRTDLIIAPLHRSFWRRTMVVSMVAVVVMIVLRLFGFQGLGPRL